MVVSLDEEAASTAGWVEHRLAELRVDDINHELHHRPRGVELTAISCGISHLAQHIFVKSAEGVHLLTGGEMDSGDFIDDIAQEVAGLHAVRDPFKHIGDDILPAFAGFGLEAAQISEEPRALGTIGSHGFVLRDELEQFVASNAVSHYSPIAPAVRRFDDGLVFLPPKLCFLLRSDFQVVEKL